MTELYKKKMNEIKKMSIKTVKDIAKSNTKYAGYISYKNKNDIVNYMLKKDLESKYRSATKQPLNKFRNIILSIAKKIAKNWNTSIWNIGLKFHQEMIWFNGTNYAGITFDSYAYNELSWNTNLYTSRKELSKKLNKIGWDFDDISSSAIQFKKIIREKYYISK